MPNLANTKQSVEQDIADAVFKQSGLVLEGNRLGDEYVGLDIDKRSKRVGRHFYSDRGPMQIVVTVGQFGSESPRTFRERQNGTFNINKIVDRLLEIRIGKIVRRKRQRENENSQTNAVEQRRLALSLLGGNRSEYSNTVEVSRYNQLQSKIVLKATAENAEKLAKILAYAEELGVIV